MPFDLSLVGKSTSPIEHKIEARELMAYAASVNDMNPRYFDTSSQRIVAHPVYSVRLEWPIISAPSDDPETDLLTPEESLRAVHAAHDIHFHL